jgi:hypothetical protein
MNNKSQMGKSQIPNIHSNLLEFGTCLQASRFEHWNFLKTVHQTFWNLEFEHWNFPQKIDSHLLEFGF